MHLALFLMIICSVGRDEVGWYHPPCSPIIHVGEAGQGAELGDIMILNKMPDKYQPFQKRPFRDVARGPIMVKQIFKTSVFFF